LEFACCLDWLYLEVVIGIPTNALMADGQISVEFAAPGGGVL
jgi:hypothetical protein